MAVALLLPLAWIFWSMARHQVPSEEERRAELKGILEKDVAEEKARMVAEENARDPDGVGISATGFSIELWTEHKLGLVPGLFATKWLSFYPRQWVGFCGLVAVGVVLVLLIVSSFVPIVTTLSNADGWETPPASEEK
jgi:hypothetical protein